MKISVTIFTILISLFINLSIHSQCYNLVWEDEFNGTSLDLNNWEYQTGGGGWGNNESQYYTNGNNVNVANGILQIIAEEDNGNQYPNNDYTSSRIRSINKGDWRYGKMEASIKLPIGQGIWPAFWMMPTESVYGTWPRSGEIDIMEYLGHQPNTSYGTCHYGDAWDFKGSSGNNYNSPSTLSDNFHTFSVEWEPTEIRWYFDEILYHTFQDTHPDFSNFGWIWPFDQEFHFILNLAVGGAWPGYPDATTVFPQVMEVDWVRVYQQISDVAIKGEPKVSLGAAGTTYTLPDIAGATYNWSVPSNALLVSGQNTNEITVNWGYTDGTITADLTTNCGSQSYDFPVTVSSNLWDNHDFENGYDNWGTNEFAGADAAFNLETNNPFEGNNSACVEILTLQNDVWNIQLGRSQNLIANEEYTLRFWAKADAMGKDLNLAIINSSDFSLYAGTNFNLTDTWTEYSFSFTAPATATAFINFDLGDELGTFCFDDFYFTESFNFINSSFNGQVLLEGAYNSNGQMQSNLATLLPLNQPFNVAPYDYNGNETITIVPNNTVDWVLVEVRLGTPNQSIARGTITINTKAGLLLNDGSIVGTDGSTTLLFEDLIEAENYHICIRHRNHLDVLSANSVIAANTITYDFSSNVNQAFGSNQQKISNDGFAFMYAGDYNQDGTIQTTDFDAWIVNPALLNIYNQADGNLDGTVQTTDYDLWFINKAKIGSVEIGF